jgi:hypothetical protein
MRQIDRKVRQACGGERQRVVAIYISVSRQMEG